MERYCYRCEKDVKLRTDPNSNAQLCAVCGAIIIHSATNLPPGTILGGFRIVDELGRGGMGIVYRARQLNLERDVALKVLGDDLSGDREFVERFFKEARAAASLNHPNIVQVFDAGRSPEGVSFFAMELIEGETLEVHIDKNGKLPPKDALKIALKIADALDYAWKSQKLTHGDIKPDNIILNNSGGAKLADLGLAKFVHDETSDDSIMATPLYAPPEVIRGEVASIGFHSDMYSFGATLYQMLAGVPPFPDNAPEIVFRQHLHDTPPPLHTYNDRLAPALVHICEQMLKKDPKKRPETWEIVHKSLKKIHEPEVSGKVFHTHLHSDSDDEGKKNNSSLAWMVKSLISLVLLLLIAITGLFFLKHRNTSKTQKAPVVADPEFVIKEWDKVKKEIAPLNTEKALEVINQFIAKFKNNLPADTLKILKQLNEKTEKLKKEKEEYAKKQAMFKSEVAKTLQLLKMTDIDSKKNPISKIEDLNQNVNNLLTMASENSYLTISEESKKSLTDAATELAARLLKHRLLIEKIQNEKIAKRQQAKLQKIKKEIAQEQADKKMQVDLNKSIDNYYTALADFKDVKKLSTLKNNLLKSDEDSEVVASQYAVRVDFLTEVIIPNANNIYKLLKSKEDFFKGETLPEELSPGKLKHYTIKGFSDKGIKLIYNNNKVTLGHTIPWAAVSHKNLLSIAEHGLLGNDEALTDKEISILASFALLFYPESFSKFFNNISQLTEKERECWRLIKNDFEIREKEFECITTYRTLCDALYREEYANAADLFIELKSISINTMFESRYAKIFPDLADKIIKKTPKLSALNLIKKTLNSSSDSLEQFNTAMVIYARYGKILNDIDDEILENLKNSEKKALATLKKRSGVKRLSDNRIPFFYWSKEKIGASQAYLTIVKRSKKLKKSPEVIQAMMLAAALDGGNWSEVNTIYNSIKKRNLKFLHTAPKRISPWLPSFLFAYGLADIQLGNGADRLMIQKAMETLASQHKQGAISPLASSLVFEYDLLTRKNSFPLSMAVKYQYKKLDSFPMSAKIAMLGILAAIDNQPSNTRTFSLLNTQLANLYKKNKKLEGDVCFVNAAWQLLKRKPLSQSQIKKLTYSKCSYPDTASRILIAALARYHSLNNLAEFKDEHLLIKLIEKNVTTLIVSGDLWRRIILFKMAHNAYADDIRKISINALQDTRISTTRFYPALLMIKAGSEFLLENYDKSDIKKFLTEYFTASNLLTNSDIYNLKIITDAHPELLIEKLFKEHQPEKAFRYGIFGIMVHCKDSIAKSKIVNVMNKYDKTLCWEERYLMKQIQNWR